MDDALRERFGSKIDKTPGFGPNSDCWRWTGADRGTGYGSLKVGGRVIDAHRVAWLIANDPGGIPPGHDICHRCDTPGCVNPAHLFLGTRAENMQDAIRKRRIVMPVGEANHRSVLTSVRVAEARLRFAAGETVGSIADDFGMPRKGVAKAISGATWAHLQDPPPVVRYRRRR